MAVLLKPKWFVFIFFLTLVISSNILIYRLDFMQPVPKEAALGSLFDFFITIPLIIYFFIIRKRYPLKNLLLVMLAGYGAAVLIIPQGFLSSYSFVKYILFAGEGAFFLLELYLVFRLMIKLPAIFQYVKTRQADISAFPYRLDKAVTFHFKPNRFLEIIASEITMFYYSFFSWRKKPLQDSAVFTIHKKTSSIALYIMLIHALVLESIGFHFLLHSWNAIVAIFALVLNVYTLVFFIAEIQAIRLTPIIISDRLIYIQTGITKRLTVPLEEIKSIHFYQGPEMLSREETKGLFDAVLPDFMKEKPSIEIEFYKPLEAKMMYGITRKVIKVHLRPDEPQKFLDELNKIIDEK